MKPLRLFVRTYLLLLIMLMVQKPVFLLLENAPASQSGHSLWADMAATVWHGLPLDLAIAAYLCVVPGLLLAASVYVSHGIIRALFNGWMALASLVVAVCLVLNLALYPYWGFPLDSTPFFYFFSSPADALASTSVWLNVGAAVAALLLAGAMWLVLRLRRPQPRRDHRLMYRHRGRTALATLLLTALLFLPIRGGVTVSTNNTGRAYFSQSAFLNHAAVNPVFSLMESLSRASDFSQQYRFMDDATATRLLRTMTNTSDRQTRPLLKPVTARTATPDILIIVLEGFASDMMASLGGHHPEVAPCLDSIATHGSVLFTHFYANSFRTDRGLVSILSGYPAQPTTSIMRHTERASRLPSIARTLVREKGYETTYYYGGDVDFCGQRAYLVSQGFQTILSDASFPLQDKLSKWGVPDHLVAQRVAADLGRRSRRPQLRVLQTSSSHEPFDVPYHRLSDERLNAFAYTDSVVGRLIADYRRLPQWKDALIVVVPDHVGGYKEPLDNLSPTRFQIPLILTGGAVAQTARVDAVGSQIDIAATLLGQLGIAHHDFRFSKNMLSAEAPRFAFFAVPDAFGLVTPSATVVYDNQAQKAVHASGTRTDYEQQRGKAFLQKLFDDISQNLR